MKEKMMRCRSCGAEIAKTAKLCPHCGAKNKQPIYKRKWLWVLGALFLCRIGLGIHWSGIEQSYKANGGGTVEVIASGRVTTSDQIIASFEESPISTNADFLGEEVLITARVSDITESTFRDAWGDLIVDLRGMYSVFVDDVREDDWIQVKGTIAEITEDEIRIAASTVVKIGE